jgi:hypothetical protein
MPMKPHQGESQSDFLARCVREMIGTGEDKRPRGQAVAVCMQIWRDEHKSDKQIDPADYDDYDEFMSDDFGVQHCRQDFDPDPEPHADDRRLVRG